VETGWNHLAPPRNTQGVSSAIFRWIGTQGIETNLYGDGQASRKITHILMA